MEFGLPALAAEIQRSIPQRLATIDERVNCVHRRVFIFRVNANCDIWGHVDRSGPVSLSGRGDRVYGAVPIYGVVEGQGANRFTSRIHGDTEARVTIEVESRPELNPDWSLNLNFSDAFHWSEPPILHVLGRDIPVAKYVEPRLRTELANVRARAAAAARGLDLHAKADRAWRAAFEPIELSADPEIWLQLTPQTAAFAGIRANANALWGSLEYSGSAATSLGAPSVAATPTSLPPLGRSVEAPGTFEVILPVRISYDLIKDKITQALSDLTAIREVQVYPSSGKLVIGLRIAQPSDTDPNAGQWIYVAGSLEGLANGDVANLGDLAGLGADDPAAKAALDPVLAQLRDKIRLDYSQEYSKLLEAADKKLTRPLKDGFRMEGHVSSAKLDKIYLPSDGVVFAVRASGELKILYGL